MFLFGISLDIKEADRGGESKQDTIHFSGLCSDRLIASSRRGLYSIFPFLGSIPPDAETTTLGRAWEMRAANWAALW